ncbi:hypothetical protein DICPUDRAFT_81405 [Dictyostelium purpureum]|uniref:Uncharacterized protein n=1 Tax=Dictyostelium purpureum TaxID=5786 RepID=F0ZTD7_DICPU|nr:uncharacterized protein DICPUDRAFT_81405 [Dictyostelium purpureum]EGC32798.1 hypothetical protein DICPUDRAFT_81405 [Dictyostelium purpureum]|eukprot:XP_003290686.1 hypothetical protein DICPUDRAFT_81405 [Dictyostelium purpureum]
MKFIPILLSFILLLSQVLSEVATYSSYALWNENGEAIIGLFNLPTGETKVLYTISGYQHFNTNQYSTFNSHTNMISFLVYNNSSKMYLYQFNIHNHGLFQIPVDFYQTPEVYSIISSNSTSEEDDLLFIVQTSNGDTAIGKLNENTHTIVIENKLQGIFCAAAFDSKANQYYTLSVVNNINVLNVFSSDGKSKQGTVNLKFPNQNSLNISSYPYNLVYLESFDTFYFWMDIEGTPSLFTMKNSNIIKVIPGSQYIFENSVAYAMASTNVANPNNQEFFQAVSIQHSSYAGNAVLNTFNSQSKYVNSYPIKVLPINMWIAN